MPENNEILPDYPITDYSGGVRTDKAISQLRDNEVLFANGAEFLPGKLFKRYGSQLFGGWDGGTPSGTITNGFYASPGGHPQFLVSNQDSSGNGGMVYQLAIGTLTAAVAVGDTTVSVKTNNTNHSFAASGTVEIDGDIITYTGSTSSSLTGVTGVSAAHSTGSSVKQWVKAYSSAQNCSGGVEFAFLNNALIISRATAGQMENWNGIPTISPNTITVPSGANGLRCLATYKQRVYGVAVDSSNKTTTSQIFYSAINDATTWTSTDNFYVNDDSGENISALKNFRGHLLIFKPNSSWYWNLAIVAQINSQVGAYNNQCVQEINGVLYVFGPKGIYATVGRYFQMRDIGQPIRKWLDLTTFNPVSALSGAVFPSTGRMGNKLLINIGNVTYNQQAYNNVILVYDTIYHYWTVWINGFKGVTGFFSTQTYIDNVYSTLTSGDPVPMVAPAMFYFGGNNGTSNYVYQLNNNFSNGIVSSNPTKRGDYFRSDEFYDTSGTKIPLEVITKVFYQGHPSWWKQFAYIRVFAEAWPFEIEARTTTDTGYSDWKSLGQIKGWNTVLPINLTGYGIQFRISENSLNDPCILTTMVIEGTKLVGRNYR